ncbi:MAG TPA: nicotinate-nucleotide adenylyltransferase [Anaerolineaceae bacterium]|nr:nicotinate-nucleotide adenylyltransferase [Anaerolineaceae bacterium]
MAGLMKIGIFGGTFDPPHMGHLILADEAYNQLHLDKLLWVLTPDPPHKQEQEISPAAQRLELVQAAILDNPYFELSRVELDRPGPHYAVDTVKILQQQYPGAELIYLVGGDSLRDLPGWHEPARLVELVSCFGVMRRMEDEIDLGTLERLIPGIIRKVRFIDSPIVDIASHDIRERIASGEPYRYLLHPAVFNVICQKKYYQA